MEDESEFHLFTRCHLARSCWDTVGNVDYNSSNSLLDWLELNFNTKADNDLCLLISICWKIWEARNEKIWNQKIFNASHICLSAANLLSEWNTANLPMNFSRIPATLTKWTSPPTLMYKLNVDAALDINNKRMGFGFALRDSTGALVAARSAPYFRLFMPNEAEAMGVKEALKWVKSMNMDNLQVESDCLQVINGINSDLTISSFDLILNDVRKLASCFTNICFLFVKRSANRVAHILAREALSLSECSDCYSVPFPSIARALSMDLT
ncbi:uncharacterized protein LOC116012436 [Ipomoea triloba]|uniref:uncharacterized protein LOC116012436 n=1 Tax=Ipomoea triloba TaxID=35885 RepID=UPI00125D366E|nr:uncharacterized protein LOC116012436 [Ipomoea triloba]